MDVVRQADFTMGPIFATFLLGLTTIILLFWYTFRKQSYWRKLGVPYVKPMPFFGSIIGNLRKPLHVIDMYRSKKFGRLYGHYEGNQALLSLAEPEILRNIFVKDFHEFSGRRDLSTGHKVMNKVMFFLRGEDWKRIRTIVSPTFSTGKIKRKLNVTLNGNILAIIFKSRQGGANWPPKLYSTEITLSCGSQCYRKKLLLRVAMMGIFNDCSETLVKNFRKASEMGEPVDVKKIYSAFTMDTIASSAFSTKLDSHNDPNNKFVSTAKQFFNRKLDWKFLVSIILFSVFGPILQLLGINLLVPKAVDFFYDIVLQIIEERKRTGQTRNDFLQLLIDTANETGEERKLDLNEKDDIAENYGKIDSNQIFKGNFKKNLSQDELVAQCVMFFVAGFDTTASTLSFVSYMLALHPDIQERLIQEVDEALEASGGEVTYEALQSMKYLDNTIAETLRLYPPVVRLERLADTDYKLGDTGLTVRKGIAISIPIYVMHRDPALFPDPERFDPNRFSPEGRAKQVPYSYLPFGAGPRNCIAMRFALMEVKTCLAHVLKNFRIKKCASTQVPLEYDIGFGFLQPKSISLFMEKRSLIASSKQ